MIFISNSPAQTKQIAEDMALSLMPGDVIALIGGLGAGKTTFVKGLALGLGCREKDVISPTFILMRQYKGKEVILNHFDLYRLKGMRQLIDIGYEEYFYSQGVTVIEWADKIKDALPKGCLKVVFKNQGGDRRQIRIYAGRKTRDE